MAYSIHPLVLESIINLLVQDESVRAIPEVAPIFLTCPDLDPVCIESLPKIECITCGGDNAACGGDDKVVLLAKILSKLKTTSIGKGRSEPYRIGDTAAVVERKILQSLCRA